MANRTHRSGPGTRRAHILACFLVLTINAVVGAQPLETWIDENCLDCVERMADETGAYILERGTEALIGRAWLTQHAQTEYRRPVFYLGQRQRRYPCSRTTTPRSRARRYCPCTR